LRCAEHLISGFYNISAIRQKCDIQASGSNVGYLNVSRAVEPHWNYNRIWHIAQFLIRLIMQNAIFSNGNKKRRNSFDK
jgi:prophage maintenance system killer protein